MLTFRQIRSLIYCKDYDNAINSLCDIVEDQQRQINELTALVKIIMNNQNKEINNE